MKSLTAPVSHRTCTRVIRVGTSTGLNAAFIKTNFQKVRFLSM